MFTQTIGSWSDLAELANLFKTERWIFRGVTDKSYELLPKIGRQGVRKNLSDGGDVQYNELFEKQMIGCFKREARPHLKIEPRSELDWLSVAQHHSLATRLLDWSESPIIAGFFAVKLGGVKANERVDAIIFGTPCPELSSAKKCQLFAEKDPSVVAYYPQHLTPRITVQRGLFTVHKNPAQAWQPASLHKWIIPSRLCIEIKLCLNKSGINEASLFPDLDGVANHINWLYKWGLVT